MKGFLLIVIYIVFCGSCWGQVAKRPVSEYGRSDIRKSEFFQKTNEKIIGANNIESISTFRKDSKFYRLSNSVGRLSMKYSDKSGTHSGFCTGFLISEDLIATNYHCIPGENATNVLEAKFDLNYISDDSDIESFDVRVNPVESREKLDYSILKISGKPGEKYGHLKFSQRMPKAGESIFDYSPSRRFSQADNKKRLFYWGINKQERSHAQL